jgi:hypothetical protein
MIQLIRGQQAPAPFLPQPVGAEGARFEQLDTGEWFLIIYMSQPTKEERKIVRKARVLSRYFIGETKTMAMALIRFESSDIIYELIFDPTRYKAIEWKDRIEAWSKSNTVSILVIDSLAGIIEAIRVANMPKTLWEVWQESWRKSLSIEDYTRKYAEWIKTLWQRKTMDLWNTATPSGIFGECYSTSPIHYESVR